MSHIEWMMLIITFSVTAGVFILKGIWTELQGLRKILFTLKLNQSSTYHDVDEFYKEES